MRDGYQKGISWWLSGSTLVHVACLASLHDALPRNTAMPPVAEELWLETPSVQAAPEPEPNIPKPAPVGRSETSKLPKRNSRPSGHAATDPGAPAAANALQEAAEPAELQQDVPRPHDAAVGGETVQPALPATFSLWLAPLELQRMVIVRSPSALLGALPGYRDLLRGSGIDPFTQLRALRVFLPGLAADQLALAGVHTDGEDEIARSAERIAASRERVPSWRGSSQLRATAWLDGSGYDRGLAVHGDTFLIGARHALPRLLGDQAATTQMERLWKTRKGVVVLTAIHDVPLYLPGLRPCKLRSLRISISDTLRFYLSADYEDADSAASAASCLAGLPESTSQLRWMRELLSRANATRGSTHSELRIGVTGEEIARLLDELCWSLRRVGRG